MRLLTFFLFFFSFLAKNAAQSPLFMPLNFENAYKNGFRSLDGAPGRKYWQNRATYQIKVELQPKKHRVLGEENVRYTNNSPDTLRIIRLKLQHDLYKKGGQRNSDVPASDIMDEGVEISNIQVNGQTYALKDQRRRNCLLDIRLNQALVPGASCDLSLNWAFTMPADENATRECVCDATTFFIPYFYPQIAVYDDVHGWADAPYNGLQEFYHEFADYDVRIVVPKNYGVWATGEWQNAADILEVPFLEKWQKAHLATDIIPIFTESELKTSRIFKKSKQLEYHFKASEVPDFTFAASDHYNWDATSALADPKTGRRTFVSAVYNSKSEDFFKVARIAADGIGLMGAWLPGYPFPYPSMTVFNGNDGMEYPMMVNDASVGPDFVTELTVHEVAHTYFPFMMGINEQYYGWMDEGWANFFENHLADSLKHERSEANFYSFGAGKDSDVPPMVPTRFLSGAAFGIQSYSRPQMAYEVLFDELGYEVFHRCMVGYMDRWKGKHPIPHDFFYTFNELSGQNLNWFWQPWFFEYGYPDLGIKNVVKDDAAARQLIVVEKKGLLPVPIFLKVDYADGGSEQLHLKASVWKDGATEVKVPCSAGKVVKTVQLGGPKTPDARGGDNEWHVKF